MGTASRRVEREPPAEAGPVLGIDYPGPVLAVSADGTAAPLNGAGAEFLDRLRALRPVVLAHWARRAAGPLAIGFDTVRLPEAEGERLFEATLVPAGPGGALLALCRDVTFERNLRTALADSRQRYKDLVDASSDFAWETDAAGTLVFVSPRGALGYAAEALVGRPAAALTADEADAADSPFFARTPRDRVPLWLRRADGTPACVEATASPVIDSAGAWCGARGVCRDITIERERDAELARRRHREQLNAFILRAIWDEIDPDKVLASAAAAVNGALSARGCQIHWFRGLPRLMPAASAGVGVDAADVDRALAGTARSDTPRIQQIGTWQVLAVPTRYRRAVNGAVCLFRLSEDLPWSEEECAVLGDAAAQIAVALEQVANHDALRRLSRTDPLTGLLNRRAFMEEVRARFEQQSSRPRPGALVYVDLDNFKLVNDRFGHQRGDAALRAVAGILSGSARAGDLVARLGGDEFALWLDGSDASGARAKAVSLLGRVGELAEHSGDAARRLGFSIGIAPLAPGAAETVDAVVARADAAMYAAKQSGKGRYALADPDGSVTS